MLERLRDVMSALDERAAAEPRLGRYRVPGNSAALEELPAGWMVSDAIAVIATHGGWWPGEWRFPLLDTTVPLLFTGRDETVPDASVRWVGVGSVWQRDTFYTPAMRSGALSAPFFGFSNQALWTSMVFPAKRHFSEHSLSRTTNLALMIKVRSIRSSLNG